MALSGEEPVLPKRVGLSLFIVVAMTSLLW